MTSFLVFLIISHVGQTIKLAIGGEQLSHKNFDDNNCIYSRNLATFLKVSVVLDLFKSPSEKKIRVCQYECSEFQDWEREGTISPRCTHGIPPDVLNTHYTGWF